jgi:5-methylcytosine-specific restriction endonuclease McrA
MQLSQGKEYEKKFMASFREKTCARCSRNRNTVCGHHVLPKSIYPEHRLNEKNIIPLCFMCHRTAHDHPKEFADWLKVMRPGQYEWAKENSHHRRG